MVDLQGKVGFNEWWWKDTAKRKTLKCLFSEGMVERLKAWRESLRAGGPRREHKAAEDERKTRDRCLGCEGRGKASTICLGGSGRAFLG